MSKQAKADCIKDMPNTSKEAAGNDPSLCINISENEKIENHADEIQVLNKKTSVENYHNYESGNMEKKYITELQKAKLELISERNRFESLVNTLEFGVTMQDRNYNILFQNDYMKKMFGYSNDKCHIVYEAGKNICIGCPVNLSFTDGLPHTAVRTAITPKGEIKVCENTASPVKDAEGKITACLEIVRDITHRKHTENALLDSEIKFASVVENSLVGVFIIKDGLFSFVNKRWCEIYGYERDEIIDKVSPVDLAVPEEKKIIEENLKKHLTGEIDKIEFLTKCVTKNGKIVTLKVFGRTMIYDGRPAIAGTVIDVTDQKSIEEALRENIAKMRSIVENIPIGVVLINPAMEIVEMNQRMRDWFPSIDPALHPVCFRTFFNPQRRSPCDNCPTFKTLKDGQVHEAVMNIPFDKETHSYRVISSPVYNAKGEITSAIELIEDITERISLEDQLRQSQKMESVGRLAGGVAHDFNNMLSVILGFTELALEETEASQTMHENLRNIHSAAVRSSKIVQQLLAFARKQTITPRILNLNDSVEDMLKLLRRLIGEDINIVWQPEPVLWPVKMDPAQIEQILVNLCVNSRDAIAGVGQITIETENAAFDYSFCNDNIGYMPGKYTVLTVKDNGCGMEKDTIDKIFEPFFSTKETGKGTGLGLATVYGIIKQNSGFINVYSEPGKGATFKIYLPKYEGQVIERLNESSGAPPPSHGETLLVVEDDPVMLKMIKMMLETQKYNLITARTPGDAIRLAGDYKGDIHVLVTDVILPQMNGHDMSQQIQKIRPGIKCLYMSGYTADVIAHRGMLDEGVNFLQKPFSVQSLAVKLREVLDND
ncbi:MAG: PAS domain S-box protein [Spirochaetota bacterium]